MSSHECSYNKYFTKIVRFAIQKFKPLTVINQVKKLPYTICFSCQPWMKMGENVNADHLQQAPPHIKTTGFCLFSDFTNTWKLSQATERRGRSQNFPNRASFYFLLDPRFFRLLKGDKCDAFLAGSKPSSGARGGAPRFGAEADIT